MSTAINGLKFELGICLYHRCKCTEYLIYTKRKCLQLVTVVECNIVKGLKKSLECLSKMKKAGTDPTVKKTLVRNYEQRIRTNRKPPQAVIAGPSKQKTCLKEAKLDHPTLCSSEALANYLSVVRNAEPPPLSSEDLNVNKAEINTKITKKLNFHFNDRIYKNLVELNTDNSHLNNKRDKKSTNKNITSIKKDLEPNIEDFCQNIKEKDLSPNIPVIKHKFKPIRNVESGDLHRLVASFELL